MNKPYTSGYFCRMEEGWEKGHIPFPFIEMFLNIPRKIKDNLSFFGIAISTVGLILAVI